MPEIGIDRVRFAYPGGADVYPEPGLTLTLESGVTALVGENGAGKTTLTKLLNGLLRPSSGKVLVAGQDVSTQSVARDGADRRLRVPEPRRPALRADRQGRGLLRAARARPESARREAAVARAIERCGLAGNEEVHPHDLGLSERKWVAIASALATDPPVMVLDEPTLGQDAASRQRLGVLVADLAGEGKLILVVTHDMDFVGEACPRTVVLTHGEVRHAGPTIAAFEDDAMIAEAGLEPPHVTVLARKLGLLTSVSQAGFLAQL